MTNTNRRLTILASVLVLVLIVVLIGLTFQQARAEDGVKGIKAKTAEADFSAKYADDATEIQALLDAGKITQAEADAKFAAIGQESAKDGDQKDATMDAVAALIGVDVDTLWLEIKAGNSIADVATANDVDPQTIIDTLVAEWQAKAEPKIHTDALSAEKANEWQSSLSERATAFVNDTAAVFGEKEVEKEKDEIDCDQIGRRIRSAVANGDLSEEDAKAKYAEICGEK